ncbi:DNA-directed RNA polymerase subunit alpha [Patescibacteria group bacterium]|nr:DNA-directed RNA polymerase subunit alpha [Patescibacteria group bacterium]
MEVTKENLKVKEVEEKGNKGTYSFEPLPTGFGYTLGNALRRVLLTSIEGAAITQIKIPSVSHQFTSIPGIKEDVVELTLNLKKVRFKIHSNAPVIATIEKKGGGKVTAKDIEVPGELEVMNKDQHIATLADSKSNLEIELIVEPGIGYSPMEERQTPKVGVIVLDALFSPVLNANYQVEPTRFGGRTDLDKIIIEIETDGSVTPKEAIVKASQILKNYYSTFEIWQTEPEEEEKREVKKIKLSEDISVDELPLQTRTVNALKKSGIETLHQLAEKSDEELADIKNVGEKSLTEVKELLEKEGLRK